MSLAGLDLNLLLPLEALLRERSVTGAATALGRSQPALSASLSRLRRHFDDELLVRVGTGYELTPVAQTLELRVRIALLGVERVFIGQPAFDPATSTRSFTVMASDYTMSVIGPALATEVARRAPGVQVALRHPTFDAVMATDDTLRRVDGVVMRQGRLAELPSADLFADSWVFLVAEGNSQVGDQLTLADLMTLPWLVTYDRSATVVPAVGHMRVLGAHPRVQVVAESFLAAPFYLAGTDRIAMIQRRVATRLARSGGVRVLECPFEVMPLVETFSWHPTHEDDPGHRWLRRLLVDVAAGLPD